MRWGLAVMAGLGGLVLVAVAAVGTVCLSAGCAEVGYLAQSTHGHFSLLAGSRPVDDWLSEPTTSEPLKARLVLARRLREFAVTDLKLPDNRSYRSYADLRRPAAVWNVAATPELSMKLQTWCFPVVGCIAYRGYYDQDGAQTEARALRERGLEVTVYPVPAYSTLGKMEWLGGDPLLNTFIQWPEVELSRLIFHELAHQVAYADGDTPFNESFATAVERLGSERWLALHGSPELREQQARLEQRRAEFRALTQRTRAQLDAVYQSALSDDAKRSRKAELMAALRADHLALKTGAWGGYAGYDAFFDQANNASLAIQGAYLDLVPAFLALFEREGRDFTRFFAAVQQLAGLQRAQRNATLAALSPSPTH